MGDDSAPEKPNQETAKVDLALEESKRETVKVDCVFEEPKRETVKVDYVFEEPKRQTIKVNVIEETTANAIPAYPRSAPKQARRTKVTKRAIRESLQNLCFEFVESPYLAYTEHGVHALFYQRLLDAIPENRRYVDWLEQHTLVVQKEYPTATNLGKSKRQHWDVSIIRNPPKSLCEGKDSFDYLRLEAAIEFGLNADEEHIQEDLRRLTHAQANLDSAFAVHLVRISGTGESRFSGRDASPRSSIVSLADVERLARLRKHQEVDIYYAVSDMSDEKNLQSGVWHIVGGKTARIL